MRFLKGYFEIAKIDNWLEWIFFFFCFRKHLRFTRLNALSQSFSLFCQLQQASLF